MEGYRDLKGTRRAQRGATFVVGTGCRRSGQESAKSNLINRLGYRICTIQSVRSN